MFFDGSMLDEILIQHFHDSLVELYLELFVEVNAWPLVLILFSIRHNILHDFLLEFVSVLQIRKLAHHTFNSVEIQVDL